MKKDEKTLTLRLPTRLLNEMREAAKMNFRSLNSEILIALTEYLKKEERRGQRS